MIFKCFNIDDSQTGSRSIGYARVLGVLQELSLDTLRKQWHSSLINPEINNRKNSEKPFISYFSNTIIRKCNSHDKKMKKNKTKELQ